MAPDLHGERKQKQSLAGERLWKGLSLYLKFFSTVSLWEGLRRLEMWILLRTI